MILQSYHTLKYLFFFILLCIPACHLNAQDIPFIYLYDIIQKISPSRHQPLNCLTGKQEKQDRFNNILKMLSQDMEEKYHLSLDYDSKQSIIDFLAYTQIDTIEQFKQEEYELIPPGPIFQCWITTEDTLIEHDLGNPCETIQKIQTDASLLEKWNIPFIFIYSEKNMTASEKGKIEHYLKWHDNIVLFNLENDLIHWENYLIYQAKYQEILSKKTEMKIKSINSDGTKITHTVLSISQEQKMTDILVQLIIYSFEGFLRGAFQIAQKQNKTAWMEKSIIIGMHSLTYSALDNVFLKKPVFTVALHGLKHLIEFSDMMHYPFIAFEDIKKGQDDQICSSQDLLLFEQYIALFHDSVYLDSSKNKITQRDELIKNHINLYNYYMSGQWFQDIHRLYQVIFSTNNTVFRYYKGIKEEPKMKHDFQIRRDTAPVFQVQNFDYISISKEGTQHYTKIEKITLDTGDIKTYLALPLDYITFDRLSKKISTFIQQVQQIHTQRAFPSQM
ncbi:MAG: hypothetical protein HAW62_00235 [Endozoicomonadaceae bacterium]|nr:hypothetical protein [Endozoicomonadaceae bacterium]